MEKFGIFELLDALAALSETAFTPPAETKKVPDTAFSVPVYDAPSTQEPPSSPEQDALGSLLARHDAISRKAKS